MLKVERTGVELCLKTSIGNLLVHGPRYSSSDWPGEIEAHSIVGFPTATTIAP